MHVNGRHIFAVFRDPAKRRLLIVISPDSGTITIKKNNLRIANNQLSTATITIIDHKYLADGSSVADPDNTSPLRVGAWLPFSLKDTLDIEGAIGLNTKSKFSLRYHTDSGWASSMAKPIFEAGVIKKADAYHFTEDSLLDDIRRVLAKKNACRVKMKQNQILTITRWKKDP